MGDKKKRKKKASKLEIAASEKPFDKSVDKEGKGADGKHPKKKGKGAKHATGKHGKKVGKTTGEHAAKKDEGAGKASGKHTGKGKDASGKHGGKGKGASKKKDKKGRGSVPHCPHCHNHCKLTKPKCGKGRKEAKKLGL